MTGVTATWLAPDPAVVLDAVGPVVDRPGGRLLIAAGSEDRLDLDRASEPAAAAIAALPGLTAIGIASVDAERTTAELRGTLGSDARMAVHPVEDPWLGARGVLLAGPEGPGLAILEPGTEGLLAALLARRGEGPCAAWLTGVGGPAAGRVRITALGPARVLHSGGRWGPFLLGLDGDPIGPSGATIRG